MIIPAHTVSIENSTDPIYNGLDCTGTFQVDQARRDLRQNDDTIYRFELALMAPVLEMTLRGFLVDMEERETAIRELGEKKRNTWTNLSAIVSALGFSFSDKLPNSTKQLQSLFYEIMHLPPITKTVSGELKFPMDRATLEKLELSDRFAAPIINGILNFRDLGKSLQVLETQIDPDWRWRCSYNIAGTTTGRFSSSKSPFMTYNESDQAWRQTGCVLPTTQALTPKGWKPISDIKDGDLIAQYELFGNRIEFVPCTIFKKNYSGLMLKLKTEQIKQTLTPEHRVLLWDFKQRAQVLEAQKTITRTQSYIPIAGEYRGGSLAMSPYAAMLMADFSKETTTWRGTFNKNRKIERFLKLAEQYDIPFWETKAKEGHRRFVIQGHQNIPKKWGSWVLDLDFESAQGLIEEARYWDGHDRGAGFMFFTTDKEQAEWFSTLAHLVGRGTTIRFMKQSVGSFSEFTSDGIWIVNVKNRDYAQIMKKHWTTEYYEGEVYCPSVPSSFWLMKEDNFISITGNSNFQNINEVLRRVFIPDPGYKLYGIDKAQSEARDVGWFCGTVLGDWSYLDACESGDLHTYVTRLTYPEWPWTGDLRKDRAIAERRFYRLFTYRDASKRLGHGTNYFGKAYELSRQIRIPLHLVVEFQDRYLSAFPCIATMHQYIISALQRERYLVNSFGRRRDFFDRPTDPETWKSAIAYMFQSATADAVNLGLYRLWKNQGTEIQILSQLHDAVYFQYPAGVSQNEEFDMLEKALANIEITQRHKSGRTMKIPGEIVGGFNWGHRYRLLADGSREEWNPRGLDGIKLQ